MSLINNRVNRWLLHKALDLVFGKEEDFDYVSTTVPTSSPPPS